MTRARAKRTTASLLAAAVLGGAGVAIALVLSGDAAAVDDKTLFCSEYVPNAQAESNYAKWLAQNPGEKSRWEPFRDAICAGQNPVPPTMTTAKGRGLVAAGKMALPESVPPPTTTTSTTTTTTTTEPPPTTTTTTPPPSNCTKVLMAGGDLSSFLATLASGDVGCLRGGTYTDGQLVTWSLDASTTRAVLTEYPGEVAEIVGTELLLSGDNLTVSELTVRDVLYVDGDGISASGANARIEHNVIRHIARNGILLHTSSTNAVVARNFDDDVGWNSSMTPSQAHGLYVQGTGHRIWRNVFTRSSGYGIHIYGTCSTTQPSDIIVAQNTGVDSVNRTGLMIRSECGTNIRVVNNVFEGATAHTCNAPCVVDKNLVQGGWSFQTSTVTPTNTINADPQFSDALYHVAAGSPAVNTARADFAYFPDRDGVPAVVGAGPDLGAYER